ncbi:uncharacterized protein LOC134279861 [Saccostrea cucullata]|uniref:uncharacterized protein LOC134279861 n=1 Tax=Saccostrea cuccullata TaxID=36930 RepID=UPI002ED1568D
MYFIAVDLCIEETPKTWREASESCNLVISNTTLRVGVPITDIPAPTFRSAQVHWIGATGTFTPWFELAGCNLYFYFPFFKQWMPSSKLSPVAQCHQLCENWRNTYKGFGINKTHCFCDDYEKAGFFKNVNCKLQNIEKFKNDLIGTGDKHGYYAFALYRRVRVSTEIDDLLGECLMETNEGNKSYPCDSADITQSTWVQRHQNNIYNSSLPRWSPYVRRLIINWRNGKNILLTSNLIYILCIQYYKNKLLYG